MENFGSAERPEKKGVQYHIGLGPDDMPDSVLLPGDPKRVEKIVRTWDDFKLVAENREFTSARGLYKDVEIGVCSTGIGSPSTAIAIEELASIGCKTFIRVGSTGTISDKIECGDFIINTASMRLEGTTKQYVMPEYPAVASIEVTQALIEACKENEVNYHIGVGASTDSFYTGQGRKGFREYWQSFMDDIVKDLQNARVLNFEMENSTLFVLSTLFGLRAGSICVVFANRMTDKFIKVDEKLLARVASDAIAILKRIKFQGMENDRGMTRERA
jgi:Uridine phosphorylase